MTLSNSSEKAEDLWSAVENYFTDLLHPHDSALDQALQTSAEAGLPPIQVAPAEARLLWILAKILGARNILEIGTLGGYSTIWLARALPPDGHLISLELNSDYAQVARDNIANAGLSDRVDIRVGHALEQLPGIVMEGRPPFDLVFIDANKEDTLEYFDWTLKLTSPGSLIIVDNVVRHGDIIDSDSPDPRVVGMRRFAQRLAAETRVSSTVIQTVGSKGYDGMAICFVRGDG